MPGRVERPLLVDGDHRVVVGLVHLHQRAIPDDAGVVDQDVDLPEGVDGGGHDPAGAVEVVDPVAVGHRRPAPAHDLLDDLFGRILIGAVAAERDADVVHHHAAPFAGQAQGDGPPDAATRAGDHCYPSVKQAHRATLCEPPDP